MPAIRNKSLLCLPVAICARMLLCFVLLLVVNHTNAQTADTSDKVRINLLHSVSLVHNKTDSGEYNKFIDSVILQQGTDTLYCDSAYQNSTTKNFEAFGDVRIAQTDGTQGTSNYLKYTAKTKMAFMQGNVKLTDGKNHLECTELTYDMAAKVGVYDKGGTLHNDSTTVTSNAGVYNVKSKESHFTGNVYIDDPQYKIYSEDIVYNTETKVTDFYAKSTVVRDSGRGILNTNRGTYDGKNGIAHFTGRSSTWNNGQYIEADSTLNYSRVTGYGLAIGHVVSIDTVRHSWLYAGRVDYHQYQRTTLATIKPVLVQANGKDTLYMRADTFYSAPMVRMKEVPGKTAGIIQPDTAALHYDSLKVKEQVVNGHSVRTDTGSAPPDEFADVKIPVQSTKYKVPGTKKEKATVAETGEKKKRSKKEVALDNAPAADTTHADTTAPLYFIGYHHVLIFSDSMQAKCDSVVYTRADSLIKLIYSPIAWAHNSQITGDTIIMQLDSNQIRRMYVPNNAYMVSQSGPAKAKLWDQVQGKTLTAFFKDNTVTKMIVYPNAECIYYAKDKPGAYIGVNQGSSVRMRIFFDNQQINTIKYEQDYKTTMTPMDQADLPNMKLSRFKWLIDDRPKSKEELFQ